MILNATEQRNIMHRFPSLKLSYDKQIHKKVYTDKDIFMVVPYGVKFLAWFTYYQNRNVCFLIELTSKKIPKSFKMVTTCFHHDLALGTILYGSVVKDRFFVCEDALWFCGKNLIENKRTSKFSGRLPIIQDLFSNYVKQQSVSKKHLIFCTPIMGKDYNKVEKTMETLPYTTYGIKFINDTDSFCRVFVPKLEKVVYHGVFKIKAKPDADMYDSFFYNKGMWEPHKPIYVGSYRASVMMNSIFRNIKENQCLDSLEESDDEDEFENCDIGKYTDLTKTVFMKCRFNPKFKKWEPIEMVSDKKTITYDDLWCVENKHIKGNRRVNFPKRN